jgi:hypothetical protein
LLSHSEEAFLAKGLSPFDFQQKEASQVQKVRQEQREAPKVRQEQREAPFAFL